MKKPGKKEIMNLVFSAFLIIGFMICAYFLLGLIKDSFQENASLQALCKGILFTVFGLILFYATRVGDGKQIRRFSAATLILVVLPALYIILTPVIPALPLSDGIAARSEIICLAGIALGYGIPYTFLSGYELDTASEEKETAAGAAEMTETEEVTEAEEEASEEAEATAEAIEAEAAEDAKAQQDEAEDTV